MNLVINNHIIDSDIRIILESIRDKTSGAYLKHIKSSGNNIAISCPFHKDGQEKHPSCFVYSRSDNEDVPFGFYKCFTCGSQGQLYKLVSKCLGYSIEDSKQWLIDNFSNTITESVLSLPKIDLEKNIKEEYLNESILDEFAWFHPYMFKRGLSKDVIIKFKIGWNQKLNTITFPIWDENGNLLGITERNINNKYFHIPENIGKPVYLLNFIRNEHLTEVYVCESQIDALYLWSLGYPSIALLGTGTKKQYEILKKSGIRIFHLALDGDVAGRRGNLKFIENMPKDIFIDVLLLPNGKDVNDLSFDEIKNLQKIDKIDYLHNINNMI